MTREKNIRFLISCARTGMLSEVMLAPVCSSWTQARHRTNVIRSYAYPWCLPKRLRLKPFSENDEAALRLGNATMSSAFRVAKAAH